MTVSHVPCSLDRGREPAVDRLRVGWLNGRGAASAEDVQGTPTQSDISPSIPVYEDYHAPRGHDSLSARFFFFTLVTGPRRSLSLKLSDTRVYEPQIRPGPTLETTLGQMAPPKSGHPPGMPPGAGGILRGCTLLGSAICPNGVCRVVRSSRICPDLACHPHSPHACDPTERLVIYCQTTSVSAAHATHCAAYCSPCRPLMRPHRGCAWSWNH